jgi:hypothetical protein
MRKRRPKKRCPDAVTGTKELQTDFDPDKRNGQEGEDRRIARIQLAQTRNILSRDSE